jgi:hypothetical protein
MEIQIESFHFIATSYNYVLLELDFHYNGFSILNILSRVDLSGFNRRVGGWKRHCSSVPELHLYINKTKIKERLLHIPSMEDLFLPVL